MARANIAVVLLLALALVAASSIDAARVVPAGSPTALHIGPVVLDDPGCRPTLWALILHLAARRAARACLHIISSI